MADFFILGEGIYALGACFSSVLIALIRAHLYFTCFWFADKMVNAKGHELRRTLFSLKRMFQVTLVFE